MTSLVHERPLKPAFMTIELQLSRGWRVAGHLSAPEAALAQAELEAALGPAGENGVEIVLSHGDVAGEGFRRQAAPERVALRGDSPRGLLFGVYAMLEELGARWPWPGEGTVPPVGTRLYEQVEEAPA